jgi:negative regulator of flagellin synthesis FlgM
VTAMTIDRICGGKGIGPLEPGKRTRQADSAKAGEMGGGKDRVEFSSVLQEVRKAGETSSSQAAARTEKLQALKEQIAEGTYRPDSTKVAASLLKFIARNG